jgi:hypothetical protein
MACFFFAVFCFASQRANADTSNLNPPTTMNYTVDGVTTDVYGSDATGYTGTDVRQSDSSLTGEGPQAMAKELTPDYTSKQNISRSGVPYAGMQVTSSDPMRVTQFTQLDKVYGGTQPQALPQTTLDSFVNQAGGLAYFIYGDEGIFTMPPLFGFTELNRINTGISSGGLTTGHTDGSLPEAWGYPQ